MNQCQGDRDPEIYGMYQRCPNPATTTRLMPGGQADFCQDCANLVDELGVEVTNIPWVVGEGKDARMVE